MGLGMEGRLSTEEKVTRKASACVTLKRRGTGGKGEGQEGQEKKTGRRERINHRRERRTNLGAKKRTLKCWASHSQMHSRMGFYLRGGGVEFHIWVSDHVTRC